MERNKTLLEWAQAEHKRASDNLRDTASKYRYSIGYWTSLIDVTEKLERALGHSR